MYRVDECMQCCGLQPPTEVFGLAFVQVWERDTLQCLRVLHGHTGSVLCLQYDDDVIVTGSSDSTIRCALINYLILSLTSHLSIPTSLPLFPPFSHSHPSYMYLCLSFLLSLSLFPSLPPSLLSSLSSLSPFSPPLPIPLPPPSITSLTTSPLSINPPPHPLPPPLPFPALRVWDVHTGNMLNTLVHHCEAVLHLRFFNKTMVTCSKVSRYRGVRRTPREHFIITDCDHFHLIVPQKITAKTVKQCAVTLITSTPSSLSPFPSHFPFLLLLLTPSLQDRTIAVWDMKSSNDIILRRVLVGHRAAVNVVDFDDRYIVSASGDRTIKACI